MIFTRCVRIVVSGLFCAGLPCSWFGVEIRCRFKRQRVGEWQSQIASFNSCMPYFGHMAYFVIAELHDINIIGSNLFASG